LRQLIIFFWKRTAVFRCLHCLVLWLISHVLYMWKWYMYTELPR